VTPLLAWFDIEGTLLLGSDPVSNAAFLPALREVYGVDPPPDAVAQIDHPGQTCQRIAREVLRAEGLADDAIDERLGAWCALYAQRYVSLLADATTTAWQAAPHAAEARASEVGIHLALLTGNPEPMAHARMERLGLEAFFPEGQGGVRLQRRGPHRADPPRPRARRRLAARSYGRGG
jgi:beta-phosphoglucomutase-like phosphatase (HAD superfamily)